MNSQPQIELLSLTTITGAVTNVVYESPEIRNCSALYVFANFIYGSGGTNAKFWVQTSFDGGLTWADVVNFAFLVASLSKVAKIVPVNVVPTDVTDATLADNTIGAAPPGFKWRVKYTTTGTYAGNTSIRISAYNVQ